jgi:alkylation response protein AidB-like acyl-CoA dehydrogenase
MSLVLSDEQKMLHDSVANLLRGSDDSASALWRRFADLGLLAMPFAEADGGLASPTDDLLIVMRLLGRQLSDLPFLASTVLGGKLISALASASQKSDLIPSLISGEATLTLAHSEPNARYERDRITTTASPVDGGYVLSGLKSLAINGARATHIIVSARTGGKANDVSGISLFLMPVSAPGLNVRPYADPLGANADIALDDVFASSASVLGGTEDVFPVLETALDHATVAAVADAVGAMEELLELTVEYLKVRNQFGVPIGSFQALQHRAVDMFIEVEQAKSILEYAAGMLDVDASVRRLAVAAAKAHANKAAREVGEAAVQLHGGMGLTLESKAARLFRRLTFFQVAFGDRDHGMHILSSASGSILAFQP